jgi:hypothetical protein
MGGRACKATRFSSGNREGSIMKVSLLPIAAGAAVLLFFCVEIEKAVMRARGFGARYAGK